MKKKLLRVSLVALASLIVGACTTTTVDNSKANTARQQLAAEGIPVSPQSVLHFAGQGDIGKVQQLLDAGVDVNALGGSAPALTVAVAYQKVDMVRFLIGHGADVNINTYHGTPLSVTSWNGNADIARILLQNGANPNAVVMDGFTPLMIAAGDGNSEVIKALVEHGADIHYAHPVTSFTALSYATYYGKEDAAATLIKLGSNVNYIDPNGASVLDWSQVGSYDGITKLLVANGAKVEMKMGNKVPVAMLAALAHENIPMIDFLVDKGISVNGLAGGKMPIVIWCAKCNVPNAALELMKLGADTSVKDADGHTALDYALSNAEKKLALAIDPKADVNNIRIPIDHNVMDQASLIGVLINDQYYQGPVTTVQNLETILSDKMTTDTTLMKDLRSDKAIKNPEVRTDEPITHPGWENANEFENFNKQIQSDMQTIDSSLGTQSGTIAPVDVSDEYHNQLRSDILAVDANLKAQTSGTTAVAPATNQPAPSADQK